MKPESKKERFTGSGGYRAALAVIPAIFIAVNLVLIVGVPFIGKFAILKHFYDFNSLVFPAILITVGCYGLTRGRRFGGDPMAIWSGILLTAAGLSGLAFRIYATHIEPKMLRVREVEISTPKVARPVRLLHLSDIQSAVGRYEEALFARIRALHPDIILYTGDFLQPAPPASCGTELPKLERLFKTLDPPLGMYGVYGNVDRCFDWDKPSNFGGMTILVDGAVVIKGGGVNLRIFGLAFKWARVNPKPRDEIMTPNRYDIELKNTVARWLRTGSPGDFTVLMGHYPDYALTMSDLPVDLCLAGHTHGGQVRLPFIGPIITASNVPRSWARGFRVVGNTRLNVSAGVGAEHGGGLPSIRFNCPPEMTIITLKPVD